MIIGIAGYARAGKNAAGEYLEQKHGFTQLSYAAPLKALALRSDPIIHCHEGYQCRRLAELVDHYGWEEAKEFNPEVRSYLQRLGVAARDTFGENFWVRRVEEQLTYGGPKDYVITDVRFPNEFLSVKGLGGQVWRINRPDCRPANSHVSERALDGFSFDIVIDNSGTLDDLYFTVDSRLGVKVG